MEIIGYILALFIGISLGLIGSGGTILAVPILVYLFKIKNMNEATHYSMFIVGTTACIGAYKKYQEKLVDIPTAIYFLIPSLLSLFFTRKIILPLIPDVLFSISDFNITKDIFLLILFGIIMMLASIFMIKNAQQDDADCNTIVPTANAYHLRTSIAAILVGILTGLLGAGGGFLIVPTLILLKNHCMRRATGTSLIIITVNSLIGFLGDVQTAVNWQLVLIFSAIAIVGMFIGLKLSKQIKGNVLKKIFGIIVLILGIYIIFKEIFL